MPRDPSLPPSLLGFLADLEQHNNRAWFQAHRERYEAEYRRPALAFIAGFAPRLRRVSPHFRADPRPMGGSLFRIHRDVRFSRDKRPYKTHCGIQFRHERGRDVHAPGFYLHVAPQEAFVGVGIWRPDRDTLAAVRQAILDDPGGWQAAVDDPAFRRRFTLAGESLKTAPRGIPRDHPLIADLRRKDFVGVAPLEPTDCVRPGFAAELERLLRDGAPLVRWLCGALGLPF